MIAQDSPTQSWVSGWVEFLQSTLTGAFFVVVLAVGTIIIVRKGHVIYARVRVYQAGRKVHEHHSARYVLGGVKGAIAFGVVAALVYLLLTNVPAVAGFFGDELPIGGD